MEEWKSDITEKDKKYISEEKIDFIYNNSADYFEELKESDKTLTVRTNLLIAYLSIVIGFCSKEVLTSAAELKINEIYLIIILYYTLILFLITTKLILPKFDMFTPKSEPQNYLIKKVMKFDLKMIKFAEIQIMQTKINENLKVLENKALYLQRSIIMTFFLPIMIFYYYLIL